MSEICLKKVCYKLQSEQPIIYFTPDGSEKAFKGSDWIGCGYYEIKKSSFGPIMLKVTKSNLWESSPWGKWSFNFVIKMKDKRVTRAAWDEPEALSVVFNLINGNSKKIKPSGLSIEAAQKLFSSYGKDAQVNDLGCFVATMKVLNRRRPFELSDFVKEYYIPNR